MSVMAIFRQLTNKFPVADDTGSEWGSPTQNVLRSYLTSNLLVQYGCSLALQTFHDFLGIFRFHPHLFQGCAKVLQEQIEVRIVQTLISGQGMGVMNIFAGIHSSAEEHGNEHNLPGPDVPHVYSFKEMAQIIILQNFAIEDFRSSLDSATSSDQL